MVTVEEALTAEGYRVIGVAATTIADFDGQGHLNNAATVRLFNDARVTFVHDHVGSWWRDEIARERYVVAAREVHVLYESEGRPDEAFVTALRYVRREGKALVLEQRLLERQTARPVARAWVVQLLVQDGEVVEWPRSYVERVEEIGDRSLPVRPRSTIPWGPPE